MKNLRRKVGNTLKHPMNKIRALVKDEPKSLVDSYIIAKKWIERNTLPKSGIRISHQSKYAYPEVSGYYIPTLLEWGMRDLAEQYVAWLLSVQNKDGSWSDPRGQAPYVFDTGQILKGLISFYKYKPSPELKKSILDACNWIISCQLSSGRIKTPNEGAWGDMVKETVHLYALSPLVDAADIFDMPDYKICANAALDYYQKEDLPFEFNQLAHFYAYVCEAFADLNRHDLAVKALEPMTKIIGATKKSPAYAEKNFECPTAIFQLACAYYKIGWVEMGDRLFEQGRAHQRKTGGFYGSVGQGADYFPSAEISWPVKYFMDALLLKVKTNFDRDFIPIAPDYISAEDGRYIFIKDNIGKAETIADVGCGKGRFLKNLTHDFPDRVYTGIDISEKILGFVPDGIEKIPGGLLSLPIYNRKFDLVFCIEAIEHALDMKQALSELARIVADRGKLIIIDKRLARSGRMNLSPWEQWCDEKSFKNILESLGFKVSIQVGIPYDGKDDDVFFGIVATK